MEAVTARLSKLKSSFLYMTCCSICTHRAHPLLTWPYILRPAAMCFAIHSLLGNTYTTAIDGRGAQRQKKTMLFFRGMVHAWEYTVCQLSSSCRMRLCIS